MKPILTFILIFMISLSESSSLHKNNDLRQQLSLGFLKSTLNKYKKLSANFNILHLGILSKLNFAVFQKTHNSLSQLEQNLQHSNKFHHNINFFNDYLNISINDVQKLNNIHEKIKSILNVNFFNNTYKEAFFNQATYVFREQCSRHEICILEKMKHIYDCDHPLLRDDFDFYRALQYERLDVPNNCQDYAIEIEDSDVGFRTLDYLNGDYYVCPKKKPIRAKCGFAFFVIEVYNKSNELSLSEVEQKYGVQSADLFWMGTELIRRLAREAGFFFQYQLEKNEHLRMFDVGHVKNYREENGDLTLVNKSDSVGQRLNKLLNKGYYPNDWDYIRVKLD